MRVGANGLHDRMRGVFGVDERVHVRGGAAYELQGVCDLVIGSEREHAQNERESAGDRGVYVVDRVRDDGRDTETVPEVVGVVFFRADDGRDGADGGRGSGDARLATSRLSLREERGVMQVCGVVDKACDVRCEWIVGERDVVLVAKDLQESTRTAAVKKVALLQGRDLLYEVFRFNIQYCECEGGGPLRRTG